MILLRVRLVAFFAFVFSLSVMRAFGADSDITAEEIRLGHRARTLIAKPRAGVAFPADTAAPTETAARLALVRSHPRLGGWRTLETDGSEDVLEVVKRLAASGLYESVEPDFVRTKLVVPDEPSFSSQWSLSNTGQEDGTPGADISAPAAWEIQHDAPDVIVAVVDTGVYYSHEELVGNLWLNPVESSGRTGFDDDANGYIDDLLGINATVSRSSASAVDPFDTDGHGSHVAGIIGANGSNGKGITGVAWKTKIMALKFLGPTGGSVSGAIACIDYAIAKKAQIINGSYGSSTYSQAEFDALKRARDAGIIFVAAAGNDSQEITTLPNYPAAYALDNIVAVAATNRQDNLASYSTYGSGLVELAAPGSSILSLGIENPRSYATLSGTSMAAPHVTGALALLRQKFPTENFRGLINRLLASVDELPALNHAVQTNGRLNLARALASTENRPFNDDFAHRAVLVGDNNTVRSSNQFATTEPGEPDHGVAGSSGSLWWSWTAPIGAGKLLVSTVGSGIDTVLAVYRGDSLTTLQRIAMNDDLSATSTASSLTVDVTPGTVYHIAIASKKIEAGLVTFALSVVPANDAFASARTLAGPAAVVAGNNAHASRESGEPLVITRALGHSVWYKWTAPATRRYQISTYSGGDPVVGIYTGTTLANLVQVTNNDDSGPYLDSLATLSATAGVSYYICVDAASGSGGAFTLSIDDSEWQYVTDDPIYTTPAIAPDGTLYFADAYGYVHAVRPDGTRLWRYTATLSYVDAGSLAIAADGTIYFGDDAGTFYALTAAGTLKWKFQAAGIIANAPAIATDGTVYFKGEDGQLYALNPDGTLKWKKTISGDTYTSPTLAPDGTIYVASSSDGLFALNPDGAQKWQFDLGATAYASPAIGADGTLYLGNYDGRFFALRPDGTERWHFDTGSPLSSSAAIDARGYVYFGSYDTKLYALDAATGAKKWDYATGDIIRSTCPVIADDGAIYIGSSDGFVHALEPDGKLRRTYATAGDVYGSPVIAGGRLYVPSADAKLYAFQIGANLAASPWPTHRQNLRRLGHSENLPGFPLIQTQPNASTRAIAGAPVTLSAVASVTDGALSYQWYFNQVALPNATSATLSLPSAQTSNAGTYQLLITGPGGAIVSRVATLDVAASASSDARLINLAVRTTAGPDEKILIVGFTIGGAGTTGTKPLLLRGVGPTLGIFGLTGVLADPKLSLYTGTTLLQENDDWGGAPDVLAAALRVGAFAYSSAASKDAAILATLPAGSGSVQISAATGSPGDALAEIYDATPVAELTSTTPRLINVSARSQVTSGGGVLIAGFVISGTGAKTVVIRAVGPTLGIFGLTGTLADPKIELYQSGTSTPIATNDNWGASANAAQIGAAFTQVGAFSLPLESKDAALLATLPPGNYSAQVSGVQVGTNASTASGTALVEVYEVP